MENKNYEKEKPKFQLHIANLFLRFTCGIITIFRLTGILLKGKERHHQNSEKRWMKVPQEQARHGKY